MTNKFGDSALTAGVSSAQDGVVGTGTSIFGENGGGSGSGSIFKTSSVGLKSGVGHNNIFSSIVGESNAKNKGSSIFNVSTDNQAVFGAVKKENSIFNKDNTLFGGSIGSAPEGGSILPAGGLNIFGKSEPKGGKDSDESDDDGGDEGDLSGGGGAHRKRRAKN